MRLIAYRGRVGVDMGTIDGDEVVRLCPLDEFYADPARFLSERAPSTSTRLARDEVEQVPPVPATARVLCAGLNYRAHAEEAHRELPPAPNFFARWASTLVVDGTAVPVPAGEDKLDWEGELAVVVGATLSRVDEAGAARGILGYACFNDLSARDYQTAVPQWCLGKNGDRTGPIGPALVTADEVGDPDSMPLTTVVNGSVVQSSSTSHMLFSAPQLIAYASGAMTLRPGDVIATGTPEGVGFLREPPRYLHPGDVVEVTIGDLGTLRTPIVARSEVPLGA